MACATCPVMCDVGSASALERRTGSVLNSSAGEDLRDFVRYVWEKITPVRPADELVKRLGDGNRDQRKRDAS